MVAEGRADRHEDDMMRSPAAQQLPPLSPTDIKQPTSAGLNNILISEHSVTQSNTNQQQNCLSYRNLNG